MFPVGKIKVLMLTSSYPKDSKDSSSVFLKYLATSLIHQGCQVHVLAPAGGTSGIVNEDGVIVHRFNYFIPYFQKLAYGSGIAPNLKKNPLLWLQVPFFVISLFLSSLSAIRSIRPSRIHAHWIIPQGLVAILAKMLFDIPVIVTAHGSDVFSFRSFGLSFIKKLIINKCDAWTTNTISTSGPLLYKGVNKEPIVIPMGVDVNTFCRGSRVTKRQGLSNNERIIIFIGRLIHCKGVDTLIEAFSMLDTRTADTSRLWIIGDGVERERLEAIASTTKCRQRIIFHGNVPNKDLPDYLAAADLFVGPSRDIPGEATEGQGVVFVEAFCSRLCVLTTPVGGIPEVVTHNETGYFVEPDNPKKLSEAISKLLNDNNLRQELANAGFKKAQTAYNWDIVTTKFIELYNRLQ